MNPATVTSMEEIPVDPTDPPDAPLPPHYLCPNCAQAVDASAAAGPVLQCPNCGTQFFPPVVEDAEEKAQEDVTRTVQEEELSAARIRQLSVLGRTAYRTRSYHIIGAGTCFGLMLMLIKYAYESVTVVHRWGMEASAFAFFAVAAFMGTVRFLKRVIAIQREINAHIAARKLEEAEAARHEPDLSTLSDGSHRARNLQRMLGEAADDEAGK
jgi:hypothetical protein